jgi:hypothetical protein
MVRLSISGRYVDIKKHLEIKILTSVQIVGNSQYQDTMLGLLQDGPVPDKAPVISIAIISKSSKHKPPFTDPMDYIVSLVF